ncbi:hypothetical protein ABIB73_007628 [Bradyrhizobium sp. F1.4.3]
MQVCPDERLAYYHPRALDRLAEWTQRSSPNAKKHAWFVPFAQSARALDTEYELPGCNRDIVMARIEESRSTLQSATNQLQMLLGGATKLNNENISLVKVLRWSPLAGQAFRHRT